MRVGFDATSAAYEKKTGTGVYATELILAYQKEFPEDVITHGYRLTRRWKGRDFLLPMPLQGGRQTLLDPLAWVSGFKFDIFHGLNTRLPIMGGTKLVATVHDLF